MNRGSLASGAGRAALTWALFLLCPNSAAAHVHVVRSDPAEGSRLTAPVGSIRLVLNESVRLALVSLRLIGADGTEVALSTPRHAADSSTVLLADVVGAMAPGSFELRWRAAGADGHPSAGTIRFSVLPAEQAAAPADTATHLPAPVADTSWRGREQTSSLALNGPGYVLIRWFAYATLAALIGAFFFSAVVLSAVHREPPLASMAAALSTAMRPLAIAAALGAIAAAAARLLAQTAVLQSTAAPGASGVALVLGDPPWIAGLLLQAIGALAALFTLPSAARQPRVLSGAAVLLAALGPALTGHAIASPHAAAAVTLDAIHVIAAAAWLGGVFYLTVVGLPAVQRAPNADRAALLRVLLSAFTTLALAAAGALLVTGTYAAWVHVGTWRGLLAEDYGRVLLLKLAIVGVMALLGALNWRQLGPRAASSADALALRRSVRLELALGIMVLLVTAVLVALSAPADVAP